MDKISKIFLRQDRMIILDGGMGREIKAKGLPFGQPEWSAKVLLEKNVKNFRLLEDIHSEFIEAGADVITTNSYAIAPFHIGEQRYEEQGKELIERSIKLASQAKQRSKRDIKIAGCIPPLFGSYRADLFDNKKALKTYSLTIDTLIENKDVDILLAETISSIKEAKLISSLINKSKTIKPYWLSFSLDDENANLRSGEKLEDIITFFDELSYKPEALLFNCSKPEVMEMALKKVNNLPIKLGVYANLFEEKREKDAKANEDIAQVRDDVSISKYYEYALLWKNLKATIIGGCCGVGPAYIKEIAKLK